MTALIDVPSTTLADDAQASAHVLPAKASISSVLAEDLLYTGALGIMPGTNQVAVFSNPFNEGEEEVLYIASQALLWFSPATGRSVRLGAAEQVVVAVHPRGVIYAFTLDPAGEEDRLVRASYLGRDDKGVLGWIDAKLSISFLQQSTAELSVQYVAGRPSEVAVHVVRQSQGVASLVTFGSQITAPGSAPGDGSWWKQVGDFTLPAVTDPKQFLCGVDGSAASPAQFLVWVRDGQGIVHEHTITPSGAISSRTLAVQGVTRLGGLYANPTGLVGCVLIQGLNDVSAQLSVFVRAISGNDIMPTWQLDCVPTDARVWTDSRGLMHVFLKVGAVLRVVHQLGHTYNGGVWAPTFEIVQDSSFTSVVVSAPIATEVTDFSLDTYPDHYPSQFVLHALTEIGPQRSSIYSQDTTTTWWSREGLRPMAGAAPYKLNRYLSNITLENAFGGPVAGHLVSLSAVESVQIDVLNEPYRLGANHQPVSVRSDLRGSVRLKMAAESLAGAEVTVSARGLPGSITINPAQPLHNFLGGTGTLPGHPMGLTADALHDAKTPSGGWVFPYWHSATPVDPEPPSAPAVLAMLAQLFRPLMGLQAGAAPDTSAGFWDDGTTRVGDYWEAIRTGAVRVGDLRLNDTTRTADVSVSWFENDLFPISMSWVDARGAAHVAEAIFNRLGAKISDVLDWLCWDFDFASAFETKDAIVSGLTSFADYLQSAVGPAANQIAGNPTWFSSKAATVRADLAVTVTALSGVSLDPMGAPPVKITPSAAAVPEIVTKPGLLDNPHVEWLLGELLALPTTDGKLGIPTQFPPMFGAAVETFNELLDLITNDETGKKLMTTLKGVAVTFTDTMDGVDAAQFAKTPLSSLLDWSDDQIGDLLAFCDLAAGKVLAFIKTAAKCIVPALSLSPVLGATSGLRTLWLDMCSSANRREEPTLGNFMGLMAALPVTDQFRAITGHAPFPDGTFPSLTTTPSAAVQQSMQLLSGLSKRGDAWTHQYINSVARADGQLGDPAGQYFAIGAALSELFFRGVTDLPIFAGAVPLSGAPTVTDKLAWGEYFATLTGYLGDFLAAIVSPASIGEPMGTSLLGSMSRSGGNIAISAFGAVSAGFRIALAAQGDLTEAGRVALITQLTGLASSLTAPMRDGGEASAVRTDLGFAEKSFVDTGAPSAAGSWRAIAAAGQLTHGRGRGD